MKKEKKKKLFEPKPYALYENGILIDRFDSHTEAKAAKHRMTVEAARDWLDLDYEIKPLKS